MPLDGLEVNNSSRFAAVLANSEHPKSVYDRTLLELDDFVVVPTMGSIVPRWLLMIPKVHSLNLAAVARKGQLNPVEKIAEVVRAFGFDVADAVWFEHGAARRGSETGCGVDHAHIHIILSPPFNPRDLRATFESDSGVDWAHTEPLCAYDQISGFQDYYVFSDGQEAVVNNSGRLLGSQYFRKQIARFVGCPDSWDYKLHTFLDNVDATVRQLSQHADANNLLA